MTTRPRPEVLALILARGGSKSIPRKNLLVLAGKPLVVYPIEQARASRLITRTIVSTDDEEIARVAESAGAEVPFRRPPSISGDLSTDWEAFHHALDWLGTHENYRPDLVVHLRATGPVRRVSRIDEAIDLMLAAPEAESLRSVSLALQTPYKMWTRGDRYLELVVRAEGVPDSQSAPRQALPQVFWQNGYVDIVRPDVVLNQRSMTGTRVLPFIVDEPMLELDYLENVPAIETALEDLRRDRVASMSPRPSDRHPV